MVWSAWGHAAALRGGDGLTHRLEHNDAFLYGAGDAKLGSIIGKGARAGAQLRARFLAKFPALAKLIKAGKAAAKKGWLQGLDGRKIPVRSEHAALNSLLQSAGAVIRSEERRVGKECVRKGRSRWSPYP